MNNNINNTNNIKINLAKLLLLPSNILNSIKPFKYFQDFGTLFARIVIGYVFILSGWGKLTHLDAMIANFREWQIPFPEIMTPFVAGFEFIGGMFLILGILTRFSAAGLAIVMLVAIKSVKWAEVDSIMTLFAFEEMSYFIIFAWLALFGAGKISIDYLCFKWAKNIKY